MAANVGKDKWFWTKEEDAMLVDSLMELHLTGKYVHVRVDDDYAQAVLQLMDPKVVQSPKPVKIRMKRMKSNFYIVHNMLITKHMSGFGWNPRSSRVVADDRVWDEYIKTHVRDADRFRNQPFPHYDTLCIIYGEKRAGCVEENGVGAEGVVEENHVSPCVESKGVRTDEDAGSTYAVRECACSSKRKRNEGETCVESLEKPKNIIGDNAASEMMDRVMTQMVGLSGLILDERLIAMSVIGRSAPLAKMFDRLDVDGKFRMAQLVANGSIN
ncbi:uncharacterized protein LOC143568385 [Bidens hawaiensis]|uniref:uncharacterized protein LOC143568385 n=1 Tax=Bidens hawaiensis TaxID=980011 RepID=UPI00404B5303